MVIPVYNRKDFIRQCLESVLRQDFKGDYEVIVVDDGSTDGTREVLKEFDSQILVHSNQTNRGLTYSRNKGIDLSRGKWVAFTDSDCIVNEDWLKELIKPFTISSQLAVVGGRIDDPVSKTYWELVNKGANFIARKDRYVREILGCNMCFRREFLLKNKFDESLKYAGDEVDLCLKARRQGYRIYYYNSAKVIHYHRTTFRGAIIQAFRFGYSRAYVNLKNQVFPYVNYGTVLLMAMAISIIARRIFLIGLPGEFFIAFLFSFLLLSGYLNSRSGSKEAMESIITYPGHLLLFLVFCFGNLMLPFYALRLNHLKPEVD